jgi:alkanal monooxygenase alpha chain
MKFSAVLTCAQLEGQTHEETIARTERLALAAEEAGFNGVFLLEHHFTPYSLCPSPLTWAAYLLGKTSRLRVGTAVCVLPLYHPVRFAEEAALVDQMSRGRLDIGLSRGGGELDFKVFGVDVKKNQLMMQEWLDIVERSWSGEVFEWNSELIKLPPIRVNPQPVNRRRPPLFLACQSPNSVEFAAKRAMSMMLSYWLDRENLVSQIELYDQLAEANGLDPSKAEHIATCVAFPAKTKQEALDAVRPHLTWWRREAQNIFFSLDKLRSLGNYGHQVREWEREIARGAAAADGQMEQSSVDRLLSLNPVGPVSECVDKLSTIARQTKINHFMCGFEGPADTERVIDAMWKFAKDVAPKAST